MPPPSAAKPPTPCSTAPSLCSPSYPGVRENPASAPTPCNRPATLLPPWCSPNLVSRLNPPHPLIHHPASARRSFLLPCPAGKPPPPSSGGTLASTRNAAKPPATSSVSWPATTHRAHQPHHRCARLTPPSLQVSDFPTSQQVEKSESRKVDKLANAPAPPAPCRLPLHPPLSLPCLLRARSSYPAGKRKPSTVHTSSHPALAILSSYPRVDCSSTRPLPTPDSTLQ